MYVHVYDTYTCVHMYAVYDFDNDDVIRLTIFEINI